MAIPLQDQQSIEKQIRLDWREAYQSLKEAQELEKLARKELLRCHPQEWMEDGVKIKLVESKGSIDYKKIPEVASLKYQYLDQYRKPSSTATRITAY